MQKLKHLLSVKQFDRLLINDLFAQTEAYEKLDPTLLRTRLQGKVVTNLFYEPSTRTSSSFYAAVSKLGGSVIPINDVTYSSVAKGETLEDTVRTLACYSDAIVLRHPEVGAATRAAASSPVPIINAGDGAGEHPTQGLLDLYTIKKEQGTLENLTVTLFGDLKHSRTAHSLRDLMRHYPIKVNLVSPSEMLMPSEYTCSGDVWSETMTDSILAETDVFYVIRTQVERHHIDITNGEFDMVEIHEALSTVNQRVKEKNSKYKFDPDWLNKMKSSASILHPLPRTSELPNEIDSDPRAAYFRQIKNGLYIRIALLSWLL